MKKLSIIIALILASVLVLTACGKDEEKPDGTQEQQTEETTPEEETTTEAEKIANDKPVSIYYMNYGADVAEKITHYDAEWSPDADLAIFGVFNSDDSEIDCTSEKWAHKDLWDAVNTDIQYKIGYEISFDVDGEHRIITILEPKDVERAPELFMGDWDTEEVTGYMGVWLYDDVNQEDGAWYSHVLPEEYNDDTLLTSIKLRPTYDADRISNFKLKAFSYSSSVEFDSEGHYCGGYGYEIDINNR